jgi:hypothetical protein
MRSEKCRTCGLEKPLRTMFVVNQQLYCEPCADQAVTQLKQIKAPLQVFRAVDPTICALCGADAGSSEFPKVAGVPFCAVCQEKIYNIGFPAWLKAGLVFTVLLLVFALVHGKRYFQAGREFFQGERMVAGHQYSGAIPRLKAVVGVAPDCEKCVLLLAKAELLNGQPQEGYQTLKAHQNGHFKNSDLASEVDGIANRVAKAWDLTQSAVKQYEQKEADKALESLHSAEQLYPEWPLLKEQERGIQISQAFDRKDYDAFLQLSEGYWKDHPESAIAAAGVASALAAKYATTGDESYRQKSEEMLEKARPLAHTDEEVKAYQEYAERIQYRLKTREIIDKPEYDRRFRPGQQKSN